MGKFQPHECGYHVHLAPTVITAARYTNAQLLAARVRLFADPNESYLVAVTAADVANNIISVGAGFPSTTMACKRYAIGNMGFGDGARQLGLCGQRGRRSISTFTRTTPANITKITIASIKNIITLATGSPANVTIKGIRFVGAAGQLDNEGSAIIDADNGGTSTGLFIEKLQVHRVREYRPASLCSGKTGSRQQLHDTELLIRILRGSRCLANRIAHHPRRGR